jgi:hypothetical protein
MRRSILIATFCSLLALPAGWSQIRGGMRPAPPARSFGVTHAYRGRPAIVTAPRAVPVGAYHHGFHGCLHCGHRYPHPGFSRWWLGGYGYPYYYGYGYGYAGYSYYPPLIWDTSSYSSDDQTAYQQETLRQIDDLSQQVQQLRQELEAAPNQLAAQPHLQQAPAASEPARVSPSSRGEAESQPARSDLATVLVFHDQHIQEVKNYAIIDRTLVVVANQRTRKIPLADLDLVATTKLNEERGVEFQVPR